MKRNVNELTENSKTQQIDNIKYKNGKVYNIKKHFLFPSSEQTEKSFRNTGIIYSNNKNQDYINTANSENINSISTSGIYMQNITKNNYSPFTENNKKNKRYQNNIYINNYKPKNRKFKVIRNDNDILKYFSKNYRKNNINKTNNILLTDFDSQPNKNNTFYLVNNDNNVTIRDMNDYYNLEKQYINNNYDDNKKISKIYLPFCIYNHNNSGTLKKQIKCDFRNCPGCIY